MANLAPESLVVHSFGKDGYGVVHKHRDYDQWVETILDAERSLIDSTPLARVEIWMSYYEEEILVWEGESP